MKVVFRIFFFLFKVFEIECQKTSEQYLFFLGFSL